MNYDFYIDESGNTGDVLNTGKNLSFSEQPVFSLACVGFNDCCSLEDSVISLKNKYKIQSAELKYSKSIKNNPKFFHELIDYLEVNKCPIFIEVVDKKYYLVTNLVTYHVLPPYSLLQENKQTMMFRNCVADAIYMYAPNSVFTTFVNACKSPSEDSLFASLTELKRFIKEEKYHSDLFKCIEANIDESIGDFEKFRDIEGEKVAKRFLPIPDDSKSGNSIWMLPNLTSFTNIYARLNFFNLKKLSPIKIFHDEQVHFDEIIRYNKSLLESLSKEEIISFPFANYEFMEKAELNFLDSKKSIPIQVADLLAGFMMRYVQDFVVNGQTSPTNKEIFKRLFGLSSTQNGTGFNLVTSQLISDMAYLRNHRFMHRS